MALDRDGVENGPMDLLLDTTLQKHLRSAMDRALRTGTGDRGVAAAIEELPVSANDRVLLQLAYSLWKGVGPAVRVQSLWGMDPQVAERLLAGLALAASEGSGTASAVLRRAADRVEQQHIASSTDVNAPDNVLPLSVAGGRNNAS